MSNPFWGDAEEEQAFVGNGNSGCLIVLVVFIVILFLISAIALVKIEMAFTGMGTVKEIIQESTCHEKGVDIDGAKDGQADNEEGK